MNNKSLKQVEQILKWAEPYIKEKVVLAREDFEKIAPEKKWSKDHEEFVKTLIKQDVIAYVIDGFCDSLKSIIKNENVKFNFKLRTTAMLIEIIKVFGGDEFNKQFSKKFNDEFNDEFKESGKW